MQIISAERDTDHGLLRGTGLWRSKFLSQEDRRALEDAVVSTRSVHANSDLVRRGERTSNLLLIAGGWACRYTTTRDGARQISALLVPGDLCNLDALLFDRLDYSVRTLTPATILSLPRQAALELAAKSPGIAQTFTWLALVENAILGRLALTLGRQSAKAKLAHLLCELSVRLGVQDANGGTFDFPLTQEQIGDALGLTSVHVNRTMQLLRGQGLVATASRTMTLRDLSQLRLIGDFDPRYLHMERAEADITPSVAYAGSSMPQATSSSQLAT